MARKIKIKLFFLLVAFLFFPLFTFADSLSQRVNFYVDEDYDLLDRERIYATLEKISQNAYFYIEDDWFEDLTQAEKNEINQSLNNLSQEFEDAIYPKLTSIYGQEWKPGIDNNYRITILLHQIKGDAGGYFNPADEYPTAQAPKSNEREMIYINVKYLSSSVIKSLVSHEFTHLITFNQKDRLRGISEEVWLNEARAEYSPTLLGYNDVYQGSSLQQRVRQFVSTPSDSLTEWQNQEKDYGVLSLFIHYLVDYYGTEILTDSLKSSKIGIPSINEALQESGFEEDFSQIFTDWTIAVFLNNCRFGEKYCFKNENLKKLKITPSLIFLPPTEKTEFALDYAVSPWSGHWYRIIGGDGSLTVNFAGDSKVRFKVPYILCQDSQNCLIGYLELDENQKGEIFLEEFGKDVSSLTLIPSVQSKILGFDDGKSFHPFSLSASLEAETQQEKLIEELLAQIDFLQKEIIRIQAQINAILAEKGELVSCQRFGNNLYFGLTDNFEVRCLQEFLKAQGSEIYPEGLVTGNFLSLTQSAIIRFQEKYAAEILAPFGIEEGTGFVGSMTRAKINEILSP